MVDAMRLRVAAVVVLLIGGYLGFNYFIRPIPAVGAVASIPASTTIDGTAPAMPWPSSGSAAIGVSSLGLIESSGRETPAPAAGLAKVMTALVVLEDKPLKVGDPGPSVAITDADVQAYQADSANHQNVVAVQSGEQLSEFHALQGLLIPSADNIATMLARWDAGSVNAFVAKMNKRADALGMTHTRFADESGASAKTTSTPSDLVKLGLVAMKQPVLAQIVAQSQANIPVAGTVRNLDTALGQSGIIGIETGNGDFLYAASETLGNFTVTLFGCVMGLDSLDSAFTAAKTLIAAMRPVVKVGRVLDKDKIVASYELPWGDHADLIATDNVDLVEWPGMVLREIVQAPALTVTQPIDPGTTEGALHITLGGYTLDVSLTTVDGLYPPGRFWKLLRI